MRELKSWTEAFSIADSEHIALVGGGGKTTTMWSMAREFARRAPTIVTSTTKAGAPPPDVPCVAWQAALPAHKLHDEVAAALAQSRLIAVTADPAKQRLQSIAPEIADELFFRCAASYVLNEADGARMKPFKAPADHEPVLASTTTLQIIVIGIDALGALIDEEHLHRPEMIVRMAGTAPGSRLTAAHIAAIARTYIEKTELLEGIRNAALINRADSGPDDARVAELTEVLPDLDLAAIVAATQQPSLRLWGIYPP